METEAAAPGVPSEPGAQAVSPEVPPAGTVLQATVEPGRIAAIGSLIWLAVLALMVWRP